MTKHTTGPWMLAGPTTISNSERNAGIATVSTYSIEQDEAAANARLIVAAPDLFAALDAMTHYFAQYEQDDSSKHVFRAARAALIKATSGQTK